jgi:hypothetical protein
MRFPTLSARLLAVLIVAFTLSACGGGSGAGGFFGGLPGTPDTPAPTNPPETGVKPEMRCAR